MATKKTKPVPRILREMEDEKAEPMPTRVKDMLKILRREETVLESANETAKNAAALLNGMVEEVRSTRFDNGHMTVCFGFDDGALPVDSPKVRRHELMPVVYVEVREENKGRDQRVATAMLTLEQMSDLVAWVQAHLVD